MASILFHAGCKDVEIEATIRAILSSCFGVAKTIFVPGVGFFIPDPIQLFPQICPGDYPGLPLGPDFELRLPGTPAYNCIDELSASAGTSGDSEINVYEGDPVFTPLADAPLACSTPMAGADSPSENIANCKECCDKVRDAIKNRKLQPGIKEECETGDIGKRYRELTMPLDQCIDDLNNSLLEMAVKCDLSVGMAEEEGGERQIVIVGP